MTRCALTSLIILSLTNTPSAACQFDHAGKGSEVFFKLADTVFTAHVTKAVEKFMVSADAVSRKIAYVEAEYEILEVLKGKPPVSNKVHDMVFGFGNCSLPIIVGFDYLFMLQGDKKTTDKEKSDWGVTEFNSVSIPTGSIPIYPISSKKSVDLLSKLRVLSNNPKQEQDVEK